MYRNMEVRRVQITGGSSYMITLPKNWAESRGIKKNDPIIVVPQPDGSLLLTMEGIKGDSKSVKVLDTDDFDSPDALYRCLIGAYIAGHDQISIRSDEPISGPYLESISEFTQTSMGMEIIEEEENRILIKDLIDHSEVIPQKNVRREYLLVKRMISDALSYDTPSSKEMDLRDTEVDRIHWLVQRQASIYQHDPGLSSRTGTNLSSVISCMSVSKTLERMGDHAVLLVKNISNLNESDRGKLALKLDKLRTKIVEYIEGAVQSWMDADNQKAEEVMHAKNDILSFSKECFKDISNNDVGNLLRGSINRIVDYCSDIAESAINVAMEDE